VTAGWLAALLGVALLAPLVCVLAVSLAAPADAIPPFAWAFRPANYAGLADPYYLRAFAQSLVVASVSTLACLAIGYPMALAIARAPAARRGLLLTLVILPFWTGFLIRITAWIGVLKQDGWLDQALAALGLPPAHLLYTPAAMYVGITYGYLPFMVLPLYASFEKLDESLLEAAADLGCPRWKTFFVVTLPLALPGLAAGALLCFIPIIGEFVIPDLLGGSETTMIGQTLWTEFFANKDWPVASAVAVVLVAVLVVPIAVYQHLQMRTAERLR
jgi:putrescine transport system permease protein